MYDDILTKIMETQARIILLCWYCGALGIAYEGDTLCCARCWIARFAATEEAS